MQLSDGRGDGPTTPRDSSSLTAALALERITRVLTAVNAVRRLDFHFLRAPSDWVADISARLQPHYPSLQEVKITISSLSVTQAAAVAAVIAAPDSHLTRIELRTTAPVSYAAAAVLAEGIRSNIALSELLLTNVVPEDEEKSLAAIGEAIAANTVRKETAGASSSRSGSGEIAPSHELRVVVGGRHKIYAA